jgi:hypothetical protein
LFFEACLVNSSNGEFMSMNKFTILLMFLASTLLGCGEESTGRPTAPTTISVTYKGKPVAGANITLMATDDRTPGFGLTDEKGEAQITTYSPGDGAIVTSHQISVTKMLLDKKLTDVPQISQDDPSYDPRDPPSVAPPKNLLPQKYSLPTTSGLTCTIEAGKLNKVDLKLTD